MPQKERGVRLLPQKLEKNKKFFRVVPDRGKETLRGGKVKFSEGKGKNKKVLFAMREDHTLQAGHGGVIHRGRNFTRPAQKPHRGKGGPPLQGLFRGNAGCFKRAYRREGPNIAVLLGKLTFPESPCAIGKLLAVNRGEGFLTQAQGRAFSYQVEKKRKVGESFSPKIDRKRKQLIPPGEVSTI